MRWRIFLGVFLVLGCAHQTAQVSEFKEGEAKSHHQRIHFYEKAAPDRLGYEGAAPGRPTVIFLHGFADYWGTWRELMRDLKDYQTVAMDLRGYGQSSKPERVEDYSISELSDDVLAVMDAVQAESVYLVGHDVGAWVAYAVANRFPARVKGVVSLGLPHPTAYLREFGSTETAYVNEYLAAGAESKLDWPKLERWREKYAHFSEYQEAMAQASPRAMLNYYRAALHEPAQGPWRIQAPVLVLRGLKDATLSAKAFVGHRDLFAGPVDEVLWPEGGHDPHLEYPLLVSHFIRQWLKRPQPLNAVITVLDQNLADAYRVKAGDDGIYAVGGPVVKYSWGSWRKSSFPELPQTNNIDLLPIQIQGKEGLVVASDFIGAENSAARGRIFFHEPGGATDVLGEEPNIHRLLQLRSLCGPPRFLGGSIFGHGAVAPDFQNEPARIVLFEYSGPKLGWKKTLVTTSLHLLHGLVPHPSAGENAFLTASAEGIGEWRPKGKGKETGWTETRIAPGQTEGKLRGAGEAMALRAGGQTVIAAIEPWHGSTLAIYKGANQFRQVIDTRHSGGHSLAALDLGHDHSQDLLVCYMGERPGLYRFVWNGGEWREQVLDDEFRCQGLEAWSVDKGRTPGFFVTGETFLFKYDFPQKSTP